MISASAPFIVDNNARAPHSLTCEERLRALEAILTLGRLVYDEARAKGDHFVLLNHTRQNCDCVPYSPYLHDILAELPGCGLCGTTHHEKQPCPNLLSWIKLPPGIVYSVEYQRDGEWLSAKLSLANWV